MPELPEVEVVRLGLEAHVVGRRIDSVVVLHDRPVRRHPAGAAGLVQDLTGRTFVGACRRGKYLWLPLDSGDALMAHLGMSGQMLIQPADAPAERHLRVRFTLGTPVTRDGQERNLSGTVEADKFRSPRSTGDSDRDDDPPPTELRFVDQRMFGGLWVSPGGAVLPAEIAHIARDPLDPLFDEALFAARVRGSRSGIKRILLNQSVVSGVGNIYADEALWRAGLHGERAGERLTRAQVLGLLDHVRDVMREALAQGGTSFDALYVNVNGQSGYFDRSLNAYGRADLPCRRCGTPMRRVAFMNRSSYFCPVCQPAPRRRSS